MERNEIIQLINEVASEGRTSLSLYNLGITELPPEIGQLKDLEHLDLSFNQLKTLPATLAQLTNLRRLSIEYNQLTRLPA